MLEGAKKVVKELGGRLPDNAKEMQEKIPGIGRYSAGAICSIAYGERVPVVSDKILLFLGSRVNMRDSLMETFIGCSVDFSHFMHLQKRRRR